MLNTKKLQNLKNNPLVIIFFCLLLIIGVSKLLLFLENNLKTTNEVEAAPLSQGVENNQMTNVIEDGYIKR